MAVVVIFLIDYYLVTQEAFINLARTADEEGAVQEVEEELSLAARERVDIPSWLAVQSPHPRLPSASDAVEVRYEAGVGRHVVASRDVQPGEVLFVETPLVSTIMDEHVESICLVCLRFTSSPLPCPTCSDVSFCSLACRTHALQSFHKY